jgi:hypothetical protein
MTETCCDATPVRVAYHRDPTNFRCNGRTASAVFHQLSVPARR